MQIPFSGPSVRKCSASSLLLSHALQLFILACMTHIRHSEANTFEQPSFITFIILLHGIGHDIAYFS